jgi:glucose/mannose-6-phosphate isomerase
VHHVLDDPGFVTRLDPKGMYALTEGFPNQCRTALSIALSADVRDLPGRPSVALLTGMGGSAAGGDMVRALFDAFGSVPFIVNRDYTLPNYVGLHDLVFCASYSGNTEETLSAYTFAKKSGAHIVAVTGGGKLAEMARADGFSVIQIPGSQPPRTALGFMTIPVIACCEKFGLLPAQGMDGAFALLDAGHAKWGKDVPFDKNPAKQLAAELHGKVAVLYGLGSWQGVVANRWKGQINENAKNLAFPNVYPELDHNEILGWVGAGRQGVAQWVGVVLEDGSESPKMKARARVTEELVGDAAKFFHVKAEGDTLLQKLLSFAYFGDFLSLYLAALNEVDPMNMDAIEGLKAELARIP